jgi:SAM-dependent methyltransferase
VTDGFAGDAADELRLGRTEEALWRTLAHFVPAAGLLARLTRHLGFRSDARVRETLSRPDATLQEAASALGRTSDLEYFVGRSSHASLAAARALLSSAPPGLALDVGCGAGHMEAAPADRPLVGLDFNFALLYLARRYVAPTGRFVCADACRRLPFDDAAFQVSLSMDVFQYLPGREAAAAQMDRVTSGQGSVILSHLRGRGPRPEIEQAPLPPRAYADFFPKRRAKFYTEREWTRGAAPRPVEPTALTGDEPYVVVAEGP